MNSVAKMGYDSCLSANEPEETVALGSDTVEFNARGELGVPVGVAVHGKFAEFRVVPFGVQVGVDA